MLKVKDNVDFKKLKEFEKYGFKPQYDVDTGKLSYYVLESSINVLADSYLYIDADDRCLKCHGYSDNLNYEKMLDGMFDIIQAGLIEKVEGK